MVVVAFCKLNLLHFNMFKNSTKTFGILLAAVTIFIWGITFVCTKYLLRSFSAFEILIVRFIIAYLGLWLLKPKTLKLFRNKDELLFMAAGLAGVTVYQFMENTAISFTSPSNVSIIVSICPMFTAIFAQIWLREKHLNIFFNIGFLIAIMGIALVSFNGAVVLHLSPKGDLLALASAVSWGFYSLFVSKINKSGYDPICATRRVFFWALVFMIPIALYGAFMAGPDSSAYINTDPLLNKARWSDFYNYLNLLFLGLGASAFAFAVWNKVCSIIGTVTATVGIYMIPVVTIIFAYFALGEKITLMGAIGALLTIGGLLISEIRK